MNHPPLLLILCGTVASAACGHSDDCTPTTGHYALGGTAGEAVLYRIGDEWDAELGPIVVDGERVALQHLTFTGAVLYGMAGANVYRLDPEPDADHLVHATLEQTVAGVDAVDAFSSTSEGHFVVAHAGSIWCITGEGEVVDNGVADIAPYTSITGVTGDCSADPTGPYYAVKIVAQSAAGSGWVRVERSGSSAAIPHQVEVTDPVPVELSGLSSDGLTVSDSAVYWAASGEKLRDTALCLGTDNLLNGSLITGLRSID